MLDRELFAQEFVGLCEVYDRSASQALMSAYYEALKDMTDDEFVVAVRTILKERRYTKLPMPGDFRPEKEADGIRACSLLMSAIERHGAWRSVCFEDFTIHRVVVLLGGWQKVCREIPIDILRRDFIKMYMGLKGSPGVGPAYLAGDGAESREAYLGKETIHMITNTGQSRQLLEAPKGGGDAKVSGKANQMDGHHIARLAEGLVKGLPEDHSATDAPGLHEGPEGEGGVVEVDAGDGSAGPRSA